MDIEELLGCVALEDVRCIERVGRLRVDPDAGLGEWDPGVPSHDLALQVNPISWGERIEVWFRLGVDYPSAKLQATYAIIYTRDSDAAIPQDVRRDFLARVALLACVPYLREAVQRIASELRLGNVIIPMIRQGDIQIEQDLLDPEGSAGPVE